MSGTVDAARYIKRIRNKNKQLYARAYMNHLWSDEPEPNSNGVSSMAAQGVRLQLREFFEERT